MLIKCIRYFDVTPRRFWLMATPGLIATAINLISLSTTGMTDATYYFVVVPLALLMAMEWWADFIDQGHYVRQLERAHADK